MPHERRPLIAGNWKMNGGLDHIDGLAGDLAERVKAAGPSAAFEMALCPPFPLLSYVGAAIEGSGLALGAQDCHENGNGAHTGDTSAQLLSEIGCAYVIVGHSERRTDHGEGNNDVRAKASAVLNAGLAAIVCLGESEAERDAGEALRVVVGQLRESVPEGATVETLVIAYEPVWAIGTGRTPTLPEVQEVHAALREALSEVMGDAATKVRILYGGSVKPGNAKEILALADVDGALVGGASLKADDFWAIAEATA